MKQNKTYGRTFFDLIGEHPKKFFFIFLFILGVAILLIIFRIPFKVGNVEVGKDTIVKHDTVVIVQNQVQDKSSIHTPIKLSGRNSNTTEKLIVKKGDTQISVQNQPANINTGTNNGIIGNDNKINISKTLPVEFNEKDKSIFYDLLQSQLLKLTNKQNCITLTTVLGNERSNDLGKQILNFLKSRGFNLTPDQIAQAVFINPPNGVEIFVKDDCVNINVYYIP